MRGASTARDARTWWRGFDLNRVVSEPLVVSLLKYRRSRDRELELPGSSRANLVSSLTWDGRQMPILDLDVPHEYVSSSTPGHAHLFINTSVSRWRWVVLMLALRIARVHETGYTAWSLRRGANFVRVPGEPKVLPPPPERQYGWFFQIRQRSGEGS